MNDEIIQRLFDYSEMKATIMLDFKKNISKEFNVNRSEIDSIIRYLKGNGYLKILMPNTNIIELTPKGFEMKNGGWFSYLELESINLENNSIK